MDKHRQKAKELLEKYNKGLCTEEEKELLETWYGTLSDSEKYTPLSEVQLSVAEEQMWQSIQQRKKKTHLKSINWMWFAASLGLLALSFVGYRFYSSHTASKQQWIAVADVEPGSTQALLTLQDGRQVDLNELKADESIDQGTCRISKNASGQLVYKPLQQKDVQVADTVYNEVSTPQGGEFQLLLPDGTEVWLNASSTIRYPLTFAANERKVVLKGEAYFEVNQQKQHPFVVQTTYQKVTVLGTHFNISAYQNEHETKTTLLEGSVRVSNSQGEARILKPNEQSTVSASNHHLSVMQVNPTEALAWKNGEFVFDNTDLKSIMRQIERWYGVAVVDLEHFPANTYNGKLKRTAKLSKVLQILEVTSGLKFKIETSPNGGAERRLSLMK